MIKTQYAWHTSVPYFVPLGTICSDLYNNKSKEIKMVKILMYLRVPLYLFCSTYGYFCTSKISIAPMGTSVSVIQV